MKTIKISKKDEDILRDGAVLIPNLIADRFKNSEKATCKDDHKLIIEQRTFFDLLYKVFRWDFTCEKHNPVSNKLGYVACHDWADRKIAQGLKQKQCPICGKYYFKCEM